MRRRAGLRALRQSPPQPEAANHATAAAAALLHVQVAKLTNQAMDGSMALQEALEKRLEVWGLAGRGKAWGLLAWVLLVQQWFPVVWLAINPCLSPTSGPQLQASRHQGFYQGTPACHTHGACECKWPPTLTTTTPGMEAACKGAHAHAVKRWPACSHAQTGCSAPCFFYLRMQGIQRLITALQARGIAVFLISGGFRCLGLHACGLVQGRAYGLHAFQLSKRQE